MYTLQLLTNESSAPFYTNKELSNENAGVDLYVPADIVFSAGEKKLVSMGVKGVVMSTSGPANYWMLPRSSISKTGLMLCNSVGVIDRSYRGELMAFLWNTTDKPVSLSRGDRVVQIVAPDMGHISRIELVSNLGETGRGEGGFGSTGR